MRKMVLIGMLLIPLMVSCNADRETQIKKSEASRQLAGAYIKQEKYTLALRELLKAEQYYDEDPDLQNDLGFVYMQKNSLDLSVEHFKRALELKPDFASARNNLGVAYLKRKQWDEAIACFKELTENLIYTTPQKAMVNMAWAYYNKKEYGLSEKYYNNALDLYRDGLVKNQDYIKGMYGISLVYMDTGRPEKAAETLSLALKDEPRFLQGYYKLAEAYSNLHAYDKARRAYRKVIEIAPQSELAKKAQIAIVEMANK